MAANINDKFSRVSTGQRPSSTTVSTNRSTGVTTLVCDDLTGWSTDDAVHFITYKLDSSGGIVAGSQTDFKGIVSGNSITNLVKTGGTDNGNSVGDVVVALPTAAWAKDLADGLLQSHSQDGSLTTVAVTGALPAGSLNGSTIADGTLPDSKWNNGVAFETSKSATQAIGTATTPFTTIAFDNELYDIGNNLSGQTFTAPVNGIYSLNCSVDTGNPTTVTRSFFFFSINGSNTATYKSADIQATRIREVQFSTTLKLNAGDTVTVRGFCDPSTNVNSASTIFSGHLVTRV